MLAFLDFGNTNIKLLLNDSIYTFSYNKINYIRLSKYLETTKKIYIATVNTQKFKRFLFTYQKINKNLDKLNILYSKNVNEYAKLNKLRVNKIDITKKLKLTSKAVNIGIDRLLSINYLSTKYQNFIFVSVGTAITVDVVLNNTHITGFIAPSFRLQKQVLLENTALSINDFKIHINLKPHLDTTSAVMSGISNITILGLNTMLQRLSMEYQINNILLSGGKAKKITEHLDGNFNLDTIDNIVLKAIQSIVEEK